MLRRIVLAVVVFLLWCTPAWSEVEVNRLAGTPWEKGFQDGLIHQSKVYQPNLVLWDNCDNGAYFLDGVSVRKTKNGQVSTVISIWDAKDQLAQYGLDNDAAIWSFQRGSWHWLGDNIYLSGLMFKKDVQGPLDYLTPRSYDWTREGYTYNVFFKISPSTKSIKLLHCDKAFLNISPRSGNYIGGIWDSRPDLTRIPGRVDSPWLYVYYFFVTIPAIQPLDDGSFITFKMEEYGEKVNNEHFFVVKWWPDGREEKIMEINRNVLPNQYYEFTPVPNTKFTPPKGGLIQCRVLPITEDIIMLTDGINYTWMNIKTREIRDDLWYVNRIFGGDDPGAELKLEKGQMANGKVYFLDNNGIWCINDHAAYNVVFAKNLAPYGGKIMSYDIKDNKVLLGNYTQRTVDSFKISSDTGNLGEGIYLNGKLISTSHIFIDNKRYLTPFKNDYVVDFRDLARALRIETDSRIYDIKYHTIFDYSGRQGQFCTFDGDCSIKEFMQVLNKVSVMKYDYEIQEAGQGKYRLIITTTGTENFQEEEKKGPPVIYGLPAAYD